MTKVIIIDDQSTSRIILEELVRGIDDDISVETFASPLVALEWAQSNQPDLILTDYKMPDMNGVELTRQLRQLRGCMDVPIRCRSQKNEDSDSDQLRNTPVRRTQHQVVVNEGPQPARRL